MSYIQQEVDKFLRGEINKGQLSESLHNIIDSVIIPDALYVKDSIDKGENSSTQEEIDEECGYHVKLNDILKITSFYSTSQYPLRVIGSAFSRAGLLTLSTLFVRNFRYLLNFYPPPDFPFHND